MRGFSAPRIRLGGHLVVGRGGVETGEHAEPASERGSGSTARPLPAARPDRRLRGACPSPSPPPPGCDRSSSRLPKQGSARTSIARPRDHRSRHRASMGRRPLLGSPVGRSRYGRPDSGGAGWGHEPVVIDYQTADARQTSPDRLVDHAVIHRARRRRAESSPFSSCPVLPAQARSTVASSSVG